MSNNQVVEGLKHTTDAITVGGGLITSFAYLLDKLVNPLLTAGVLILTIVWTYYRIQEIKAKRDNK